jgi:membrane protease YdiL (CAAX protease family)
MLHPEPVRGASEPATTPPLAGSSVTLLLMFFLLTFAITWSCFIGAGRLAGGSPGALTMQFVIGPLVLLGTFAPGIVALFLTFQTEGTAAVVALLLRLFQWRVRARWYAFALLYMAAIKLLVAVAHRLITGGWPRFGSEPWYVLIAATFLSTVVLGQSGEEVGWRGFALPRLAARFGLGWSSVILGVIWACWHLPLFFMPGIDKSGQSFPVYVLQVTALSVAFAWLYANTSGSLLLAMLMHAAVNQTKDIVPSIVTGATNAFALSTSLVAWLTVAFLWLGAVIFLFRLKPALKLTNWGRISKVNLTR